MATLLLRLLQLLVLKLLLQHGGVAQAEPSAAELAKIDALLRASTGSLADAYSNSSGSVVDVESLRIPSVFVMGSQKGGSSSLYELLIRHPALCGAIYKEPNFFLTNVRDGHDLRWYLSLFIDQKCLKRPRKLFVDGSCMLHGLDAALTALNATYGSSERLKSSLRFIALLREPVARDYSWFRHRARGHLNRGAAFTSTKTFGECFRGRSNESTFDPLNSPHCHVRGDYLRQLQVFTRFFRRDQVLVLNSNLLFSNSPLLMPAVAQFLGVKLSTLWTPPFPRFDHIDQHIKSPACVLRAVPELDCATRDQLAAFYRPKNMALEEWINRTQAQGLAPRAEPPFASFGDQHLDLPCVPDARAALDKVVANSKRTSCAAV